MKTLKLSLISCLALLFFFASANLSAQQANETIDKNTLILIKHKGEKEKIMTEEDVERVMKKLNIEDEKAARFMMGERRVKTEKAFLGIYSSTHDKGIVIDKVVKNSAAEKAGLLAGDIITSINGYNIRNVLDLKNAMKESKVGSVINVQYIRGEKTFKQNVTLGKKASPRPHHYTQHSSRYQYQVDPCKVFIGVYTTANYDEKGVKVTGIIKNTPAMEANIQKGDIITAIDGLPVRSHRELKVERDKHNQGDAFEISYIRQGVAQNVTAYFKSCEEQKVTQEQPVEVLKEVEEVMPTTPAITQPTNNTLAVEGFETYPNPTFGNITMNFRAEAKPTLVRITDATGRVLFTDNLNQFDGVYKRELDVSNGNAGVLTITITQDGKIFAKNIVLLTRA